MKRRAVHKFVSVEKRILSDDQIAEMERMHENRVPWKKIAKSAGLTDAHAARRQVQLYGGWAGGKPLRVPDFNGWDFSKDNV